MWARATSSHVLPPAAADKVAHVQFDTRHGYSLEMRNTVYPWFAKCLGLPPDTGFQEPNYQTEAKQDLLAFNESVPASAIRDHKTLVNRIIETHRKQLETYQPSMANKLARDRERFAEGLRLSTGVQTMQADGLSYEANGSLVLAGLPGERGELVVKDRGIRIPVWRFCPAASQPQSPRPCTLLVHGQGRATLASKTKLIEALLAKGHRVQMGHQRALRERDGSARVGVIGVFPGNHLQRGSRLHGDPVA